MFNPTGFTTFGELADFLLRSSVVLTLALAAAAILRRKPAALRHFVLSVFLIGLLLLPILSFVPGGWRTSLLPRGNAADVSVIPFPAPRPLFGNASETVLRVIVEPALSGSPGINAGFLESPDSGFAGAGRPPVQAPGNTGRVLSRLLLAVWAAGLGILLLRLGLGLAGASRLTRGGRPLTGPAWRILLARFLAAVSLRREVRLKSHDAVAIPLTWGLIRPVILLPAGAESWTEDERATVLCHELSHVKRADFLVMLLVRMSLALAWPNPLTWIVFGILRRDQEKACDEMVLRTGLKPSVYAANLLSFRRAAGRRFQPAAALLGLFSRSPLQERLAAILKHRLVFREVKMKTKLALGCAVILSVALIGTARPAPVAIQETEAASAGPAVSAAPAQATQPAKTASAATPAAQEEQEEKAKAKAKAEAEASKPDVGKPVAGKKIVITPAGDKKARIEIVVTEPGKEILISSGGKEFAIGRSGDVRIEIKGADLKFIEEGEHLEIADGQVLTLKTAEPDVLFLSDVFEPGDKAEHGHYFAGEDQELKKKLEEIREQLKQVKEKKLAIEDVEKSLAALTETVKSHPAAFTRRAIKIEQRPKSFTIARAKYAEAATIVVSTKDKEGLVLVLTTHPGKIERERYDRTVTELKQALPEGCTLESEFKEDSGAIVVTVKGPKLEKDNLKALIEKLASIMKKAESKEAAVAK